MIMIFMINTDQIIANHGNHENPRSINKKSWQTFLQFF